jgi:membrane protein YqaA with SNARE-associated domain
MWEVDYFCGMTHQIPPLRTFGSSTVLNDSFRWAGLHKKVGDSDVIIIHWLSVLTNTMSTINGVTDLNACIILTVLVLISQHGRFLMMMFFWEVFATF